MNGFDNPGMSRFFTRHLGCAVIGADVIRKKDKATIAAHMTIETERFFIPIPPFRFIFRLFDSSLSKIT